MTPKQKENGNKLYKFMMTHGVLTKEQMLEYLGWDKNKDRQLRDLISCIAKKVPVISTSDSKGYYIAKTEEDVEKVIHQWKEWDSRIEEAEARKIPLIKFYEKYRRK
jgi:hypothetical protein